MLNIFGDKLQDYNVSCVKNKALQQIVCNELFNVHTWKDERAWLASHRDNNSLLTISSLTNEITFKFALKLHLHRLTYV